MVWGGVQPQVVYKSFPDDSNEQPGLWTISLVVWFSLLPSWFHGKESACQWGSCRRHGCDPWPGKIPWRKDDNPLQYSYLENPRDGGAWWAAIYGVAQSWLHLTQYKSTNPIYCAAVSNNGLRLVRNWNFSCLLVHLFHFPLKHFLKFSLQIVNGMCSPSHGYTIFRFMKHFHIHHLRLPLGLVTLILLHRWRNRL